MLVFNGDRAYEFDFSGKKEEMKRYGIDIYLEVEAKDEEEAMEIVDRIVNASFEPEIDQRIRAFSYADSELEEIEEEHECSSLTERSEGYGKGN